MCIGATDTDHCSQVKFQNGKEAFCIFLIKSFLRLKDYAPNNSQAMTI